MLYGYQTEVQQLWDYSDFGDLGFGGNRYTKICIMLGRHLDEVSRIRNQ